MPTVWLNTRGPFQNKNSYRLWWGAVDQCTMSHVTYTHIKIQRTFNCKIEMYIWKREEKNNNIVSPDATSWPHQLGLRICFFEITYVNNSKCNFDTYFVYMDTLSIQTRIKAMIRKQIIQPTGLSLIPRRVLNGMEKMCQHHRSN